jgi:hypothetical protein
MGIGANPLLNQTPPPQAYQQDPRYARTQTPEFQALVAQQRDLAGKMNSYVNQTPQQQSYEPSLAMPFVGQNQNQNFMSSLMQRMQAADSARRLSSLGANQSPGYGDVQTAEMPQVAAEYPSNPPASIGGKGGGAGPQPAVMPQQAQRQPDMPSGIGGKGGGAAMPSQMPGGYDSGFTNNYPGANGGQSNGSGGSLGGGGNGGGGMGGGMGGGQKKLTLGEVGLTFDPSGGGGGGGFSFAEGGNVPSASQGIASLGRGNDTQLVHMTPREVGALQNFAMSQGGSLTVNPHTGLPEAGFLDSMLPTLLGVGASLFLPGVAPWMVGAGIGGLQAARTGDLGKGIMAGLGAYGGAGLGGGLASMGASATNNAATAGLNAAADSAGSMGSAAYQNALTNNSPMMDRLADMGVSPQQFAQQQAETAANAFPMPAPPAPNAPVLGSQRLGDMAAGAKQLNSTQGLSNLVNQTGGKTLAAAAAPMVMDAIQAPPPSFTMPTSAGGNKYDYVYDPKTGTYGPPKITHYAAEGGEIKGYKAGGPYSAGVAGPIYGRTGPIYGEDASISSKAGPYQDLDKYSALKAQIDKMSPSMLDRLSKSAKDPIVQAAATTELYDRSNAVTPYVDQPTGMAQGGIASLGGEYAAGGKLLQGPGDGMSDSIPAVIKGAKPQRAALAQGEFVIPADVVSHLGNGSTDAGAKRLYAMMDKVRHARTGNKKQGKQINPERFMPT